MAPRAAGKGHMKDTIHAPRPGTQACPAGLALLVLPFTAAVDRPGAHTAHPSCSSSGITSVVCRRPRLSALRFCPPLGAPSIPSAACHTKYAAAWSPLLSIPCPHLWMRDPTGTPGLPKALGTRSDTPGRSLPTEGASLASSPRDSGRTGFKHQVLVTWA